MLTEFPYHRTMKSVFTFLLILSGMFLASAQPTEFSGSFEEMKAEALRSNKPFAVYFHSASFCSPCQALETQTLGSNTVSTLLNEEFLYMKLNAESLEKQGFQLAAKYRVSLFPAILLFSPDGSQLKSLSGMQTPSMILPELRAVIPEKPEPVAVTTPASSSAAPSTRARASAHAGWWQVSVASLPSKGYGLQVGVYSNYETILTEIHRLQPHYDYPMAIRAEPLNGQTVFKLVFGPFADRSTAKQFERKYERGEGRDAVVVELGE